MPSVPKPATPRDQPKEPPRLHISLPKEGMKGVSLSGVDLEEEVTLTITGKITELRQDEYGRSLSLHISKLAIEREEAQLSITEALKQSNGREKG